VVRLDAATADGQAESEPGSVLATLGERPEHASRSAARQTSAMILDIDQDAIRHCVRMQRDIPAMLRKLERVLQQIAERRKQNVSSTSIASRSSTWEIVNLHDGFTRSPSNASPC
jgi:hypothetical protein